MTREPSLSQPKARDWSKAGGSQLQGNKPYNSADRFAPDIKARKMKRITAVAVVAVTVLAASACAQSPPATPTPVNVEATVRAIVDALTPIPTATLAPTLTPQPTPSPQPTSTPQPTASPQPTSTPAPTATPAPIPTQSPTETPTPQPTAGCSNGVVIPAPKSRPDLVRDCEILLKVKDDLAETAELNWSENVPIWSWQGITVGERPERVIKLVYGFQMLGGIVPPELGRLDALVNLDLTDNGLTGTVPPELGKLSNLEHLDIGVNGLTGSIPHELGQLAKLERFDVGQNQLTGSIPPQLGKLLNLRSFIVGANFLTGEVPKSLARLTYLTEFFIDRNMLTGCVPDALRVGVAWIGRLSFCDDLGDPAPSTTSELFDCANGIVIPSPRSRLGLVGDCETLLSIRDTLAGTASLNWSDEVPI